MRTINDLQIETLAESCVNDMGDIFWDFDPARDIPKHYSDPVQVALNSVKKTLMEFAEVFDGSLIYPPSLRAEYKALITELPDSPPDSAIIATLVEKSAWTERGSQEIVALARRYGCSILRNSLALTEAMDIEDGEGRF